VEIGLFALVSDWGVGFVADSCCGCATDLSFATENSNLRLFRKGVMPKYEDAANKAGGKWVNRRSLHWRIVALTDVGCVVAGSHDK
jgi:hypothetical protein